MKKTILTLSALVLFSQVFANCLQTIFEFQQLDITMYDKNLDGLVPDSAYWDKGTADSRGESIYIWKAYWNDGRVDSLYEANLRNGEWKYQTTVNTTDIKVNHEGNIWIIESKTMDGKVDKETIYFDGDSLAITNNDGTNIYVMKKDTLFRPRPRENFIITMDEKDTNTCYEKKITKAHG